MELLLESILALFAAIGIWTIGRLLYDFFMSDRSVYALVCARDDAVGVEQVVCWLLRRTRKEKILLIDCGLSEDGKTVVQKILQQNETLLFYPRAQAEIWAKEAEIWTK